MPRDQEASIDQDPATSDGPLFGDSDGQFRDDPAHGDTVTTGATPIGDKLAIGRHASESDTEPDTGPGDVPGEWVAGSRGPGHAAAQDGTVVPEQTDHPVVETSRDSGVPADSDVDHAADHAATGDTTVPGAPGTGGTTGVQAASAALVTNGDQLHESWAEIQSSFVDDPRRSVSQAADLVSQVTNTMVGALQERARTLRGVWDSDGGGTDTANLHGGGTDTENLRNALRDYRAYFELLIKL